MKKIYAILTTVLISTVLFAQSPQKMSYQAVLRNSSDQLVINQVVGMQISILQGSSSGTAVYVEPQTPNTNANGLVTIEIGGGTPVTGTFAGIDWSAGSYFIKTETDITGGETYSITGTSQLLSVPYALYSKTSEKANDLEIKLLKLSNSVFAGGVVTDVDFNVYYTVKIGTQVWMAENLKTTKFNDDTAIEFPGTDNAAWQSNTTGAYAWFNNDESSFKNTYGALYNWKAVNTGKLCPTDWHVPTYDEFITLRTYLGGSNVAGGKVKETGTSHWNSPNTGATNETGFTALPGSSRNPTGAFPFPGSFYSIGENGIWWSSTSSFSGEAYQLRIIYQDASFDVGSNTNGGGCSIRCIKN